MCIERQGWFIGWFATIILTDARYPQAQRVSCGYNVGVLCRWPFRVNLWTAELVYVACWTPRPQNHYYDQW